jgi:hypothetical protein
MCLFGAFAQTLEEKTIKTDQAAILFNLAG